MEKRGKHHHNQGIKVNITINGTNQNNVQADRMQIKHYIPDKNT